MTVVGHATHQPIRVLELEPCTVMGTVVIPRPPQECCGYAGETVAIPQEWSVLLWDYSGDRTDFLGNNAIVNVHKSHVYYATCLQCLHSTYCEICR